MHHVEDSSTCHDAQQVFVSCYELQYDVAEDVAEVMTSRGLLLR